MLLKTRGIIIRAVKYSETSIITDIYTEQKGRRSYIISGVRSKKARTKAALLQLMALVDLVVYHRDDKDLTRIKEIKAAYVYQQVPFDIVRGTVGLFMTEIIQKTVKEEEENPALFVFLYDYFVFLDTTPASVANIHLCFLLDLSAHLGFSPSGKASWETPFFDLREGRFVAQAPDHVYCLDRVTSSLLYRFLQATKETAHQIQLAKEQRKTLLIRLLDYYYYHVEHMQPIQAHLVLEEVLH